MFSKILDKSDFKNVLNFIASLHVAQNIWEAIKARKSLHWLFTDKSSKIKCVKELINKWVKYQDTKVLVELSGEGARKRKEILNKQFSYLMIYQQ